LAATQKKEEEAKVTPITKEDKNEIAEAILAHLRAEGIVGEGTKLGTVAEASSKDFIKLLRDPAVRTAAVQAVREVREIYSEGTPGWVVSRAWRSGAGGKTLVALGAVGGVTVLAVVVEGGCRIFGVTGPLSMLFGGSQA